MKLALRTGRYAGFEPSMGVPVSITLGRPRWRLPYVIAAEVNELKPYGLFDVTDRDEFTRRYRDRLDRIGVERIGRRLQDVAAQHGGPLVLLCFEDVRKPGQWCHRRVWPTGGSSRRARSCPRSTFRAPGREHAQYDGHSGHLSGVARGNREAMTGANPRPIPGIIDRMAQQFQSSIHVRLPPALHEQLRAAAEEQRMSLNAMVVTLLAGGIGWKLDGGRKGTP